MLSAAQIEVIIATMKPYSPKKIGLFGSVARGEATELSDIDILYNFENGITLFQLARIKAELEGNLGKEVDLVSENFISKYLRDRIISETKLIYEA